MVTITISHDPDVECPADQDCQWTLYSFCRRHVNFKDPDDLDEKRIKALLRRGLAWKLSYFEHGRCEWFRQGGDSSRFGGDWQWDGVDYAGLLVWEHDPSDMGPKTIDGRARDADAFLREYTAWANGDGLFFSSCDPDDPDSDQSCGGFLDRDHLLEHEVAPIVKGKEFVIVNESGERYRDWESLVVEFNGGDCTPGP